MFPSPSLAQEFFPELTVAEIFPEGQFAVPGVSSLLGLTVSLALFLAVSFFLILHFIT